MTEPTNSPLLRYNPYDAEDHGSHGPDRRTATGRARHLDACLSVRTAASVLVGQAGLRESDSHHRTTVTAIQVERSDGCVMSGPT